MKYVLRSIFNLILSIAHLVLAVVCVITLSSYYLIWDIKIITRAEINSIFEVEVYPFADYWEIYYEQRKGNPINKYKTSIHWLFNIK